MPSLSRRGRARLKPYMKLAEQLGSFAGQLTDDALKAVAIEYDGARRRAQREAADRDRARRRCSPQLATVNMVNAPVICRERDIRVSETLQAEPATTRP